MDLLLVLELAASKATKMAEMMAVVKDAKKASKAADLKAFETVR